MGGVFDLRTIGGTGFLSPALTANVVPVVLVTPSRGFVSFSVIGLVNSRVGFRLVIRKVSLRTHLFLQRKEVVYRTVRHKVPILLFSP